MKKLRHGLALAAILMATASPAATAQPADDSWRLVWSEEFDNDGGVDTTVWNFEKGFVRNNELQWYQEDNAYCKSGLLVIEGRKENRPNPHYKPESRSWRRSRPTIDYSSSSINTRGKKEFQYGRFEVRARIPAATGSWPAIWTLGTYQRWPSCGEIDMMEFYQVDGKPHILANAAWGSKEGRHEPVWNSKKIPYAKWLDSDPEWATKFHVWRMDWDENAIRLYLDDELLNEIPLADTVNGAHGAGINPFKQPHYILLNLAMGSNGGQIDPATLPLKYEIDYVRVYQK